MAWQMSSVRNRSRVSAGPLTAREMEVLSLVAEGQRSRTVASVLGLSEATVKHHLYRIYRKLGVPNRVGATRWYVTQRASGRLVADRRRPKTPR
jgi:DNA-binding CsgD family transcriptional regulator